LREFAMLMTELSAAVAQNLPVKIILLKNNSLAEVKFERDDGLGPVTGDFGAKVVTVVAFCRR
jgi:thiamine pyrophosphate-dependent acetolactate synthase large subunit-like protein